MRNFITLLLILILSACSGHHRQNETLTEINALCDSNPALAMSKLDAINSDTLSDFDRHHFDLLRIKSLDKAYVEHTSDSLILNVVEYFESNPDSPLYPEALYYAGRVYADMRNYPEAAGYFNKALLSIADKQEYLRLKVNVLSQKGRLLDDLELYSQAIPYVEDAIQISEKLNDSIGIAYDNIMLLVISLRMHNTAAARKYWHEAMKYSSALIDCDKAWLNVTRASILLSDNEIDSALNIIRPEISRVDSTCYNYALATAAEIYLKSEITDTAFMYAKELVSLRSDNNRHVGYSLLLHEKFDRNMTADTLKNIIWNYSHTLEDNNDSKKDIAKILHEESVFSEQLKNNGNNIFNWKSWMTITFSFLFIVSVIAILYRYHSLHSTVDIKILNIFRRKHIGKSKSETIDPKAYRLREELLSKLTAEIGNEEIITISETILASPVYATLCDYLKEKKCIPDASIIWTDLQNIVTEVSPDFIDNFKTLTLGKSTPRDLQTALLTKCGISPTDMATLLSIAKNSISTRRSKLCKLILGHKSDHKKLDMIIRSL